MKDAQSREPLMANPKAERVKEIARLSTRSGRAKAGRFLAEGPQAVREARQLHTTRRAEGRGPVVHSIYTTTAAAQRYPELVDELPGVTIRWAEPEVIRAMADTVTPQGMIAVCERVDVDLTSVLSATPRLVAVLCSVQDPGNAGTILRAADAAGADAVITTNGSVDVFNPKAVRSTVGSIFHLPIVVGIDFAHLVQGARSAGLTLLAADGYGDADLDDLQDEAAAHRASGRGQPLLGQPTMWLFGNEGAGLMEAELAAADRRVAVPLYGVAESLNVGTAATVCLYASARAHRAGSHAQRDAGVVEPAE
ncbi:TrmH family RNA methyltransferase [Zhihengliuella flava]|uniref:TrmH family RNA methyltransferase n=1 Tax=Zhihengliuella flava TaxID=1285193 RepID=A0A931DBC8_9MICC|nr:RNA methyltransferase [Zhihengliuella flava]MBG6083753.1 TrmH family RNA methyltransferase [Zhihengliuella flava]